MYFPSAGSEIRQKWEDEIDNSKTLKRRHANNVKVCIISYVDDFFLSFVKLTEKKNYYEHFKSVKPRSKNE